MHDAAQLRALVDLLPALIVVLASARAGGSVAERIGQPRVLGEMVAGVLLGPSLLGAVAPGLQEALFPAAVQSQLGILSTIGLTFFMFLVGAEVQRREPSAREVRHAVVLAAAGIVPVFLLGAGAGLLLHPQLSLPGVSAHVFALFIGCALSVTAFPLLARIIADTGLTGSDLGLLTLLAAAVGDAVAWCFLALIAAVAGAGTLPAALTTVAGGAAFAVVMLTLVRRGLRPLGTRAERRGDVDQATLALVVLLVLSCAWLADRIGVFSLFGGFVAGLAMPRSEVFRTGLRARVLDFVVVLLVPVFFARTGLATQLGGLLSARLALPLLLLLGVAYLGKYGGCTLAMRALGHGWREASAVGALMNARGLMELVILDLGLSYGLISPAVFSLLVVVAIVTTATAMPAVTALLGRHADVLAGPALPVPTAGRSAA